MRWTRTGPCLRVAACLLGAAASCAPPDASLEDTRLDSGWSAPEALTSPGGSPTIAVDRNGETLIVWTQTDPTNTSRTIYATRHRIGAGDTTPVVLARSGASAFLGSGINPIGGVPSIATGPDGVTIVGWNQLDAASARPAFRRFIPGTGWSEIEFPPADPLTTGAFFAGDEKGGLLLATTTRDEVRVQALGPGGWEEAMTVGVRVVEFRPSAIGYPKVAVDPRGRAVVIWWYFGDDGLRSTAGIRGVRRDETGRWNDPSWINGASRACCYGSGPGLDANGRAWYATQEDDPYLGRRGLVWRFTDGGPWDSAVGAGISSGELYGSLFDAFGPPALLVLRTLGSSTTPGGPVIELAAAEFKPGTGAQIRTVGRIGASDPPPRGSALLARSADGTQLAAWSDTGLWVASRPPDGEWTRPKQIAPEGCSSSRPLALAGSTGSSGTLIWSACGERWLSRYSR